MSLSTEARSVGDQQFRCKGDTICVLPDLLSDLLEDDLDLNKSYPCAQRPKKNLLALRRRYYPGSLTGECNVTHIDYGLVRQAIRLVVIVSTVRIINQLTHDQSTTLLIYILP